jgi:hypothetical protein
MTKLQKSREIFGNWESLEEFRAQVNTPPKSDEVKTNPQAKNSLYLPISLVEAKLDTIYNGLWKTHSYTQQVIGNEVSGSIILEVFHPAGMWISRVGTAAVMIQMVSGSDVSAGLSAKIKNTLVKDIPHLKAECLKNAAKSLGDAFGRSLNRPVDYGLTDTTTFMDVESSLSMIHDIEGLEGYFKSLPKTLKSDQRVKRIFMQRKRELSQ